MKEHNWFRVLLWFLLGYILAVVLLILVVG